MSADRLALLRGVNVGGKNKLPMADLAQIFAALGCKSVKTFIQSGNVVFEAGTADLSKFSEEIGEAVRARFGFRPAVILRTKAELDRLISSNPFKVPHFDEEQSHVAFLDRALAPETALKLRDLDVLPDRIEVVDREVFLYLPNGVSQSRLTPANFFNHIGINSIRNWRTTRKLAAMLAD